MQGVLHQSKITISKPEGRFESSNLHRYGSHTSIHSGVFEKSPTTLSHNINEDWKHSSKGASGDKIDETGMTVFYFYTFFKNNFFEDLHCKIIK